LAQNRQFRAESSNSFAYHFLIAVRKGQYKSVSFATCTLHVNDVNSLDGERVKSAVNFGVDYQYFIQLKII